MTQMSSFRGRSLLSLPRAMVRAWEERIALRYLNRTRTIHLSKFPQLAVLSFDYISNCIAVNGQYEAKYLDGLKNIIDENDICGVALDIGANIGNHAVAFSGWFEKVFAFEPNPRVFQILEINSRLRNNIECFPCGLSDKEGEAVLSFDQRNLGGGIIAEGSQGNELVTIGVQLKRLDSILPDTSPKVGLIKIDVEGAELGVLMGGQELVRRDRPAIVFEIIPSAIRGGKSDVVNWLRNEGYSNFVHLDEGRPRRLPATDDWVEKFYQMVVALP